MEKNNKLVCKKCGSENINVQIVESFQIKRKGKTIWYWISFVWVIDLILWFVMPVVKIILKIFKRTHYSAKTKLEKNAVCQDCGYSWRIK